MAVGIRLHIFDKFHPFLLFDLQVYKGIQPLVPEDIAEEIVWAASRPPHVNIAEVSLGSYSEPDSILKRREVLV